MAHFIKRGKDKQMMTQTTHFPISESFEIQPRSSAAKPVHKSYVIAWPQIAFRTPLIKAVAIAATMAGASTLFASMPGQIATAYIFGSVTTAISIEMFMRTNCRSKGSASN